MPYAKDRSGQLVNGSPAGANHQTLLIDGTITQNLTLTAESGPYVFGDVRVADGATLTIEPGTVLMALAIYDYKIGKIGGITVLSGGAMQAQGTALRPVVFTEHRDNYYGRYDSLAPSAEVGWYGYSNLFFGSLPVLYSSAYSGAWTRVTFVPGALSSVIDQAIIRYAGEYAYGREDLFENRDNITSAILIESDPVTIANTTVERGESRSIVIAGANPIVIGSQLIQARIGYANVIIRAGVPTLKDNYLQGGRTIISASNGSAPVLANNRLAGATEQAMELVNSTIELGDTTVVTGSKNILLSGTLPDDLTMGPGYQWTIDDQLFVPAGVTLTIEAGTRVGSLDKDQDTPIGNIEVSGRLLSLGTLEAPVLFTAGYDFQSVTTTVLKSLRCFFYGCLGYYWHGIRFNGFNGH